MDLFKKQSAEFANRHIGPDAQETMEMLAVIGVDTLDELIDKTVPSGIRPYVSCSKFSRLFFEKIHIFYFFYRQTAFFLIFSLKVAAKLQFKTLLKF
jgi:hypothetical protein